MSVAFWSVKLTNNKPVEVQPPEGYVLNVQQAAISGEGTAVVKVNTVSVEGDKIDAVICTLRSKTTDQVNLSLVFGYDVPVAFVSEGKGEVYLSGYYQPGPEEDDENDYDMDDEDDEEDDEEEDSEDEEDEDSEDYGDEEANIKSAEAAIAKLGAANKQKKELVVNGKKLIGSASMEIDSEDDSEEGDEEDSEDEDDSEEERVDQAFIQKMIARNGLDKAPKSSRVQELDKTEESGSEEDDSEDDEEDSEEDSEEDEEESEEEPPVKVQKSTPKGVVTASGQKSNNNNQSKPNTPAAKPQTPAAKAQTPGNNNQVKKPNTPGNNGNNGNGNKTPNGGNNNKTPNTNNNKNNNNNNSGFKSGDKRKR